MDSSKWENVVKPGEGPMEVGSPETENVRRLNPPALPVEDHGPAGTGAAPKAARDRPEAETEPESPEIPLAMDAGQQPFEKDGTYKVGLIGGKGTGKTYLFQSIVYRASGHHSGALSSFRGSKGITVFMSRTHTDTPFARDLAAVNNDYRHWRPLGQTKKSTQKWYRLRFPYRSGWLGFGHEYMDVDFLDGSGEHLQKGIRSRGDLAEWRAAYLPARVMIFCLPIWAVFPDIQAFRTCERVDDEGNKRDMFQERKDALDGFVSIVEAYRTLRSHEKVDHKVRVILVLTMADDQLCSLRELRRNWIDCYMQRPDSLARIQKGNSGTTQYFRLARERSEHLTDVLRDCDNPVSGFPELLDFGAGRPWIVPASALDGSRLDTLTKLQKSNPGEAERTSERLGLLAPRPVHVELPLLVALCEKTNALM